MPVTQGDMSLKKSAVSNDIAAQNGGRLTDTAVPVSLFPDISGLERSAGIAGRFRKVFLKNEAGTGTLPLKYADSTLTLLSGKVFMENTSAAGDRFLIKAGTPTDVQTGVVDSGWAGTGYLEADINAGATTCQIRFEANGSVGELLQCADADATKRVVLITDYINGLGNREFVTLDQTTGVVWGAGADANRATLTFTSTPLQYAYKRNALTADRTADILTSTTIGYTLDNMTVGALVGRRVRIKSATTGATQVRRITANTVTTITVEYAWNPIPTGTVVYEVLKTFGCMCVAVGDVKADFNTLVATCGGGRTGAYTGTGNLKLFGVGTRDDHWTLLFSSTTAFSITGDSYGLIAGSYSKSVPVQPPNGSSYHFELGVAGWSGTWDIGDMLTFNTVSASKAIWIKQIVPAGIDPHLANGIDVGAGGDTV